LGRWLDKIELEELSIIMLFFFWLFFWPLSGSFGESLIVFCGCDWPWRHAVRESGNSRFLGFGLGVRLQIWRMWIRESGGGERVLLCVARFVWCWERWQIVAGGMEYCMSNNIIMVILYLIV